MSLSSAKAMLDAQGGDPVTGYISKADVQGSYDELVNDTALTGTTTAAAITCAGVVTAAATSGFILGAGGPKMLSGTGSPEGVVTAPAGSMWTDTAATTGAVRWCKASGAGNTGWIVEYGDTGWRDITTLIEAGVQATNAGMLLYVRRQNGNVQLRLRESAAGSATGAITVVGSAVTGFMCDTAAASKRFAPVFQDDSAVLIPAATLYVDYGSIIIFGGTAVRQHANIEYPAASAWPAALPGVAA